MHRKLALAFASVLAVGLSACGDSDTGTVTQRVPDLVIQGSQDPDTAITLEGGNEDQPFEVSVTATGGTSEEYRWSLVQGQLPSNVFLTSSGTPGTVISGTPTNNGVFRFTLQVEDSDGNTGTQRFELSIDAAPPAVSIVTETTLPEGATEDAYSTTIEAVDGSGEGYTWSLVQGGLPPGLSFTTDGISTTISGTPTEADAYSFRLRVEDSKGDSDERRFIIVVQDSTPPLEIRTTIIVDGIASVPYSPNPPDGGPVIIESVGGKGTERTWSVVDRELPPGVELSKDPMNERFGWLQGVPTLRGTYPFRLRVEDEAGNTAERSYTVIIDRAPPPLRILTVELPDAEQNSAYFTTDTMNMQIPVTIEAANGSRAGYTWSVIEGRLPNGLTLAPSGTPRTTLGGTPTEAGDFEFVVQVEDSLGNQNSFLYTLRVAEEIIPITITTASLPDVTLGDTYETQVTAANGFGAYNWVVTEGSLPLGIELQVPGTPSTVLTGIAGEVGTFTSTITVYDLNNNTASRVFTLTVLDGGDPLDISSATPPTAVTCQPYAASIEASEGSNFGYTWSIDASSPDQLPAGFSIDTSGTPNTFIRGIPSVETVGSYDIVVRVEDSSGQVDTQALTIEVEEGTGGQRFAVVTGDINTDGVNEVSVVDICRTVPTAPMTVSPINASADYRADSTRTNVLFSPDGTKLAFIGNWNNTSNDDLWVVDLAGSSIVANSAVRVSGVRNGATGALDPMPSFGTVFTFRWSPDGNWLAYVADGDTSSKNEMYAVDVTDMTTIRGPFKVSGAEHQSFSDIESGSEGELYAFSPNSQKLAWIVDSRSSSVRELWGSDLSSGTPTAPRRISQELPSTSADVLDFKWAGNDGIVFVGDTETVFRDEIWLANVASIGTANATVQRINPDTSIATVFDMYDQSDFGDDNPYQTPRIRSFSWDISPDGNRLFYIGDMRTSGDYELNVVSIRNGVVGTNNILSPTLPQFADVVVAAWSPDGTKIAFSGDAFQDGFYEIGVVEVGDGVTALAAPYKVSPPVTPGQFNGAFNCSFNSSFGSGSNWRCFDWSPDSRYVATHGDWNVNGKNELYIYDTTQGSSGTPMPVNNPQMQNGADVEFWLWSPDGSKVAYQADEITTSQDEYYVYDVATGSRSRLDVGVNRDVYHYYSVRNMNLFWSIDGSRLFYSSDEETDNVFETFVRDILPNGEFGAAQKINSTPPTNGDTFELMVQTPGRPIYSWPGY